MSFILLLRGYVMYYFIVNPSSSSGKGMKTWQTVEHLLRSEHVPYHVFFTSRKKQGEELAHMISSRHSPCTIVAVGGDGTANEVISGLTNYSQIQFGYIPSGSGNDLAAGLNLKISPSAALQAILHPKKSCQSPSDVLIRQKKHIILLSAAALVSMQQSAMKL